MSGRDSRIDAAKGVLITLVVVAHFVGASPGTADVGNGWHVEPQRFLLLGVYLAHMPLFIFFVGVTASTDRLVERVTKLLVLLVSLHVIYSTVMRLLTGSWPHEVFIIPFWVLWFLGAMIWWLIALPLVQRVPRASLAASIAGSIAVGFAPIDGYIATFSRAVVFLPFFIIGHLYGRRILDAVGRLDLAHRLAATLALLLLTVAVWSRDPAQQWFYGSHTFDQLGVDPASGVVDRLGVLVVTFVASALMLCLMPQRASRFEGAGRNSLAIYALHPAAVLLYDRLPWPANPHSFPPPIQTVVAIVIGLAVVAVFARPIFDRSLRVYSSRTTKVLHGIVR